jgi:hypothetical protein
MEQPKLDVVDALEIAVDQAIAVCDGDTRAALRAAIVASSFLQSEVDRLTHDVSVGFMRGKVPPARKASEKVDEWREVLDGKDEPGA